MKDPFSEKTETLTKYVAKHGRRARVSVVMVMVMVMMVRLVMIMKMVRLVIMNMKEEKGFTKKEGRSENQSDRL